MAEAPCSITWDGGAVSESWHDAANWDLDRVPEAGDHVCVPAGAAPAVIRYSSGVSSISSLRASKPVVLTGGELSVTDVTEASSTTDLTINGGLLGGAGDITVSGRLTWTGGRMGGSGTTLVSPGAALQIAGTSSFPPVMSDTRVLYNQGAGVWSSGSVLARGTSATQPAFVNSGSFEIAANGGFARWFGNENPRFVNTGSVTKTAAASSAIGWSLENDGSIDVQAGSLDAGPYAQTSDGEVRFELRGTNPGADFGRLSVGGTAKLSGRLTVATAGGFSPVAGSTFEVLRYVDRNGEFAAVAGSDAGNGLTYNTQYEPRSLKLVAESAPSDIDAGSESAASRMAFLSPFGSIEPALSDEERAYWDEVSGRDGTGYVRAVESVGLTPRLDVDVTVDKPDAIPGDTIEYAATARNLGSTLELAGRIDTERAHKPSTVTSYFAYVEYLSAKSNRWTPLAGTLRAAPGHTPRQQPPISSGLSLMAEPIAAEGVVYPAPGDDQLLGASLGRNSRASWVYGARIWLTPEQIAMLTDDTGTKHLRFVHRIETAREDDDRRGQTHYSGNTEKTSFAKQFETQSGDLRDLRIEFTDPGGEKIIRTRHDSANMARLGPGETQTARSEFQLPPVARKGADESDEAYLARLRGLDGKALVADVTATALANGRATRTFSEPDRTVTTPVASADSTQRLPVVTVDKSGPESVNAGGTAVYDIALRNEGGATAKPAVTDSVDGGAAGPADGVPESLASSGAATAHASVPVRSDRPAGDMTDTASVDWSDENGNAYGPVSDNFTSQVVSMGDEAPRAPPVDTSVPAPSFDGQVSFLYEGDNPVQTGVDPEDIKPERVSVLRGIVKTISGEPLSGVKVTIDGHPEYGQTTTRVDGALYMVVNGGGSLTLNLEKPGFLPAQRSVVPDWRDYAWLDDDVVLVELDDNVDEVDLDGSNTAAQVAQGSPVSDASGARQATLIFQPGTRASAVMADGAEVPISAPNVRATEITVGPNGPQAMPGDLPPTSAYTYAVAFTTDESIALKAKRVKFTKPVINYVENFLNFPVGENVPTGYQDPSRNVWVPEENGRIVRVESIDGGVAALDVEGRGDSADATALAELGITDDELRKVAELYEPGEALWRVPIPHFSNHGVSADEILATSGRGWDHNFPFGIPADAQPPPGAGEETSGCSNSARSGSVIECESQTLGEMVELAGVPFDVNYSSGRVPGGAMARSPKIVLSEDSVPASLKRIDVIVEIAGRSEVSSFAPDPSQSFEYVWDGKDVFGRTLGGVQDLKIRVGYVYDGTYGPTRRFGSSVAISRLANSDATQMFVSASRTRQEATMWRDHRKAVVKFDLRGFGLGGWTPTIQHFYDQVNGELFRGDGQSGSASPLRLRRLKLFAGDGSPGYVGDGQPAVSARLNSPQGIAVDSNGSVFIADTENNRVRRVAPDGTISTVAGTGGYGFSGDGQLATAARLAAPAGVAIGPGDELFIADTNNNRIRRIDRDGVISTIGGGGPRADDLGDGGAATSARLSQPVGVAVAPWGDIYISDSNHHRVRRVSPDGRISTYAGTGSPGFAGDGDRASKAKLNMPAGLDIDQDGNLLVADTYNHRVRRIAATGLIETVIGGGDSTADRGTATEARLLLPRAVATTPSGEILVSTEGDDRVRRMTTDGKISTIAGGGNSRAGSSETTAASTALRGPAGVAISPGGEIYISERSNHRVSGISLIGQDFTENDLLVPSSDGAEIYQFTAEGRHLRTLDATTSATVFAFGYDEAGRLATITDGDGNVTTFNRDDQGRPVDIVGPYGRTTRLSVGADGYLSSIVGPDEARFDLTYQSGGLLSSFTNPKGQTSRLTYDAKGRLVKDENAAAGYSALARTDLSSSGHEVRVETAAGRTSKYKVERLAGSQQRVHTDERGLDTTSTMFDTGEAVKSLPDATTVKSTIGPDPRLGLRAPFSPSSELSTPSGKRIASRRDRTVSVGETGNLLTLTGRTDTSTTNGKTHTTTYERTAAFGPLASNTPVGKLTDTTPANRQTTTTIDQQTRALRSETPGIEPLDYTYDPAGRLITATQGTRQLTFTYNPAGDLATTTDPLGRQTSYDYDAAGRITAEHLPGGRTVAYTYDQNGNITTVTPPDRPAHDFSYDLLDMLSAATVPAAGPAPRTTAYAYDNPDHDLTKITRPSGATAGLTYDSAGRLTTLT
ncbi:MAG: hypothetical protein WBK99_07465, partial [Solirubrobacterales bacterium]